MMQRRLSLLFVVLIVVFLGGCSEEQQNRLGRLGVTWLEGDYRMTYGDGET
jgi:hypothetical protein